MSRWPLLSLTNRGPDTPKPNHARPAMEGAMSRAAQRFYVRAPQYGRFFAGSAVHAEALRRAANDAERQLPAAK